MIRDATEADIPQLVKWGWDFAASVDLPGGYDEDSAAETFRLLIERGILLIVPGKGAVGALLHPSPYNKAHVTGQEMFWWVDTAARGGRTGFVLFEALEAVVFDQFEAGSFTMSTLGDHGIARFLERRGYRHTDRNYVKIKG